MSTPSCNSAPFSPSTGILHNKMPSAMSMYDQIPQDESSSSAPFLNNSEENVGLPLVHAPERKGRGWFTPFMVHASIFTAYCLFVFWVNSLLKDQDCHPRQVYTPVRPAIVYEKVSYDGLLDAVNPFRGEPRPELDEAWQSLFDNNNIRLTKDEIGRMNKTSTIMLADGSGYYGQISALHHLHCLKFLRKVHHNDYYHIEASDREMHVDHCFDDIRQALMCHADTSVVTWNWRPNYRKPFPDFAVDHECVSWDALNTWASERSFSLFDQKSLVHPQLGLSYPLVNGSIETVSHGPGMHIVWPDDHQH